MTPHRVQLGQRLARHYFRGRFAGGLQFLHAISHHNQHVPTLGQIGFVPQRAMPRNDLVSLSTKDKILSAATIILSIFPQVLASMTG